MSVPDSQAILNFLDKKIELWNAGKRDELTALYKDMAPTLLTFEYVGGPVIDGWQALDDMWEQYGETIEMEIIDTLINGKEVACYVKNHRRGQPGIFNATVETYVFEDGKIHERYFYGTGETN